MKSCHFNNMDGPRRFYAKRDVRKRQIPYDTTYALNLKNK